jgi:hypothetical protein
MLTTQAFLVEKKRLTLAPRTIACNATKPEIVLS